MTNFLRRLSVAPPRSAIVLGCCGVGCGARTNVDDAFYESIASAPGSAPSDQTSVNGGTGGFATAPSIFARGGVPGNSGPRPIGGSPSSGGVSATAIARAIGGTAARGVGASGGVRAGGGTTANSDSSIIVRAKNDSTCALVSGNVYCWGWAYNGSSAASLETSHPIPILVKGLPLGVIDVAVGYYHACAVLPDSVQCWGINGNGQLGNATNTSSVAPVRVVSLASGVMGVVAGAYHTCAMLPDFVRCWGFNSNGQLGARSSWSELSTESSNTPVGGSPSAVFDTIAIAAGFAHTCSVNGSAMECWGSNSNGQLGVGPISTDTLTSYVPLEGATAIDAGANCTCAVVAGQVQCWGANAQGQLGNAGSVDSEAPVFVRGITSGATAVAAGDAHACAIVGGAARCWGNNDHGQLGIGSVVNSSIPRVLVTGLTSGVTAIAAGRSHSCAVVNRRIWCWGANNRGQLGDGGTHDQLNPVAVRLKIP